MQPTNRSDEEKAALIARFEKSGLRARKICREQGVAYQSFLAWPRFLRRGGPSPWHRASARPGAAGMTPAD